MRRTKHGTGGVVDDARRSTAEWVDVLTETARKDVLIFPGGRATSAGFEVRGVRSTVVDPNMDRSPTRGVWSQSRATMLRRLHTGGVRGGSIGARICPTGVDPAVVLGSKLPRVRPCFGHHSNSIVAGSGR